MLVDGLPHLDRILTIDRIADHIRRQILEIPHAGMTVEAENVVVGPLDQLRRHRPRVRRVTVRTRDHLKLVDGMTRPRMIQVMLTLQSRVIESAAMIILTVLPGDAGIGGEVDCIKKATGGAEIRKDALSIHGAKELRGADPGLHKLDVARLWIVLRWIISAPLAANGSISSSTRMALSANHIGPAWR